MHFAPAILKHFDTGRHHEVFLPEPIVAGWHEDEVSDTTNVTIGESTIEIPTHLLRRVIDFGLTEQERAKRTSLGHDCAVFALACETSNSLGDTQFGVGANRLVRIDKFDISVTPQRGYMCEPVLRSGEIAFTANALPHSPDFFEPVTANMHLMVRAGSDEQGPIYLSKFGRIGPVAAHRLSTSLDFYPAQTIGQASRLSITPAISSLKLSVYFFQGDPL